MTKKDFQLIASVIRKYRQEVEKAENDEISPNEEATDQELLLAHLELLVRDLCNALKKDNPRFRAEKFAEACGIEDLGEKE